MQRKLKKYTYVYFTNTDKDCNLLQGTPVLLLGRMPHYKGNRNCSNYN